MKIVWLVPSLGGGGAERATLALAAGMSIRGHHCTVVVMRPDVQELYARPSDLRFVDIPSMNTRGAVAELWRLVMSERPDFVYACLPHLNILAAAICKLASLVARRRITCISSVHNNMSEEFQTLPNGRLLRRLSPWAYRNSGLVVAVSHGVAEEAAREFGAPRVVALPNPIDLNALLDCAPLVGETQANGLNRSLRIAMVGRLVEQKNYGLALESFELLKASGVPFEVRIVGDGPDRECIEREVERRGLAGTVVLLGRSTDPYSHIAWADVLLLTSRYEGFGIVLLEAMALGTAVISVDCPFGPAEILEGGKAGILVDPSSSAISGALSSVASEPQRLSAVVDAARSRVRDFDTDVVVAQLEQLLASIDRGGAR